MRNIVLLVSILLIISCSNSNDSTGSNSEGTIITVTDYDNNVYQTITVGNRVWMAENLKVTHYQNGDPIPTIESDNIWENISTGANCEYDNNASNVATYGRLYNWSAVIDSRGLAPIGWHVASMDEWQTLVDSLGGSGIAGGKLKKTGITQWNSPNTGATNEIGFTALPGGHRNFTGRFWYVGQEAYFWTTAELDPDYAWCRKLKYDSTTILEMIKKKPSGLSVRCVRSQPADSK